MQHNFFKPQTEKELCETALKPTYGYVNLSSYFILFVKFSEKHVHWCHIQGNIP